MSAELGVNEAWAVIKPWGRIDIHEHAKTLKQLKGMAWHPRVSEDRLVRVTLIESAALATANEFLSVVWDALHHEGMDHEADLCDRAMKLLGLTEPEPKTEEEPPQ
jgi:hypothetical protein